VVKLFAQSDFFASPRVERQIDDCPLGAHYAKGQSQRAGLAATLEYDVGATVRGPVTPEAFQGDGRIDIAGIDNVEAQVGGDLAACRGGLDENYRCCAVHAGEERRQQTHDAGAGDSDPSTAHAVGEAAYIGAVDVGGSVQQCVRADRSHVCGVYAQHRLQ
jgi:hypothetical protein